MTITVFGASGKVGRMVVAEALRRGITVQAFVHSHNPFSDEAGLIVVKGDIYSRDDVTRALQDAEAVISCLGSWGTKKRNVLTVAMQQIIPVMQSQGITRIVTLTGSGAAVPYKKPGVGHRIFMKSISWTPAGKVFADGEQHMSLLQASNLDWTTIRSPVMTNHGTANYLLRLRATNPFGTIPRTAVVQAMLDLLESSDWPRQAPIINRKK